MEIFNIIVLSLSGLLLSFAGTMRLFKPIKSFCLKAYSDNSGLKLEGEVDVFSEMRGAGALTLFSGIVILLGTIIPGLRLASFVVAALFFSGFAAGRLLSLGLDGKPNKDLVQGTISEVVLGVLNIICLVNILLLN